MRKAWWTATAYLSAWADSPPRRWRWVNWLDGGGYIVAGETTETSIPGVYAVGDADEAPPSVVTAVADGAVAVHMAEKYIAENR